jgi:ribonuclease D
VTLDVPPPVWIASRPDLEAWLTRALRHRPVLAIDTESSHYRAYHPRICLIQLATGEGAAFVDPLAIDEVALEPLFEVLTDGAVEKVLHSARNDLVEMDRDYGVGIESLFDTEIAARFLGYSRSKLSWLYQEILDVEVPDGMQTFDWTRRPLPEKATHYALADVVYLLDLREHLEQEIESSEWAEPFRQTCEFVAETTRHRERPFDPEGWRRIKAAKNLSGIERARLQHLYRWRHEVCQERNLAAFLIVPDHDLVRLAKAAPDSLEALKSARGRPKSLSKRHERSLLDALTEAAKGPIPPERLPPAGERPDPEELARFDRLRRWRNKQSNDRGLPSEFVATNDTLRAIAAHVPTELDELDGFDGLLPWHIRAFGEEILRLLR